MGKIEVEESLILDSQSKRLRSAVISAGKQSAAVLEKNQKRDNLRKVRIKQRSGTHRCEAEH